MHDEANERRSFRSEKRRWNAANDVAPRRELLRLPSVEGWVRNADPVAQPDQGTPIVTRIRDHEIHAIEYGLEGPHLLLLHGLSGSASWWARNIHGLSKHRRVIVPDLIGFGRSRPVRKLPRISDVAALLIEWLDRLSIDRLSVAGHSMGGQISVHLATQAGDRLERLALIDASGIPRTFTPAALVRFAAEVGPLWRWGDPSFLPVIARDALTAGPRVLMRAIYHITLDDVRPLLPRIGVPTLVLWGERDTLVPLSDAWEFRRAIPNARLAVLRGAAHNPMVDRPSHFNRILSRFLDGEPVGR